MGQKMHFSLIFMLTINIPAFIIDINLTHGSENFVSTRGIKSDHKNDGILPDRE